MKILVDQNISYRFVKQMSDIFPDMQHVRLLGLLDSSDYKIFMSARHRGFAAVFTQDEDFYNLLLEHGPPPKIIWLRTGNCSTSFLNEVVLRNAIVIHDFLEDEAQDCLEIYF